MCLLNGIIKIKINNNLIYYNPKYKKSDLTLNKKNTSQFEHNKKNIG